MIVIFLGPPGSGKGTQADLLAQSRGWVKLSTGDMMRREVAMSTDLGKKIANILQSGGLVPDTLITEALIAAVKQLPEDSHIILDGYPRSLVQAQSLDRCLPELHQQIAVVFDFMIGNPIILDRLAGRYQCQTCHTSLQLSIEKRSNTTSIECPHCHAMTLSRRNDDNPEVIVKRLEVFSQAQQHLTDYYQNKGVLKKIDAALSPEAVAVQIETILSPLFA